jgi:hypothetical protein
MATVVAGATSKSNMIHKGSRMAKIRDKATNPFGEDDTYSTLDPR